MTSPTQPAAGDKPDVQKCPKCGRPQSDCERSHPLYCRVYELQASLARMTLENERQSKMIGDLADAAVITDRQLASARLALDEAVGLLREVVNVDDASVYDQIAAFLSRLDQPQEKLK